MTDAKLEAMLQGSNSNAKVEALDADNIQTLFVLDMKQLEAAPLH